MTPPSAAAPRHASADPPEAQLARFMARFDAAVCGLAQEARAVLRRQFRAAFELVDDNYNAIAIGFSPTEKTLDAIVSVAARQRPRRATRSR